MRLTLPIGPIAASAALALGACAEQTSPTDPLDLGYEGTGIGVTIAPLNLPGITDACFSFEILNGADTPERVVARGQSVDADGDDVAGQGGDGGPVGLSGANANPVCSTRFGNSQGAISYVAPCDASDGNEEHTVRLWVNSVCAGGTGWVYDQNDATSCQPLAGFVNPCPGAAGCAVTAECVENADTPVEFNFTIMASAQQGFFDIAVNFNQVFCSAKFDTCYEDGTEIELIHDYRPTINGDPNPQFGQRMRTMVAAVACTGGPGSDVDTHLNFTQVVHGCGAGGNLLLHQVTAEGNQPIVTTPGDNGAFLPMGIYYGTEALEDMNKVYTTFAMGMTEESCWFGLHVVPTDGPLAGYGNSTAGGTYDSFGYIVFEVNTSQSVCANTALNDGGDTDAGTHVFTRYHPDHVLQSFNVISFLRQDPPGGVSTFQQRIVP